MDLAFRNNSIQAYDPWDSNEDRQLRLIDLTNLPNTPFAPLTFRMPAYSYTRRRRQRAICDRKKKRLFPFLNPGFTYPMEARVISLVCIKMNKETEHILVWMVSLARRLILNQSQKTTRKMPYWIHFLFRSWYAKDLEKHYIPVSASTITTLWPLL